MYAPSPRSIVGTGLSAKLDIRVKCIHRCSAAFPEASGFASLLLIVLGVLIGYPIHSGAQEGRDSRQEPVALDTFRHQQRPAQGMAALRVQSQSCCVLPPADR